MRTLAALLLSLTAAAQDPAVFRAGVALVHVDAEVTAADGRILSGFTKDDWRVFDEGSQQTVVAFSAEEEPLDLILLFDVSGSMRPVVAKVAAAAHQGLAELRQGDRVSVMVFNTRSRVISPFTEDLAEVQRAIEERVMELHFGGGTKIQAAVDDAARRFLQERRTGRRRAVLIITDDIGTRTRRESAVVRDFWEADAILSGLIIRSGAIQAINTITKIISPTSILMQAGMRGIAEKTGGDAIRAEDAGTAFRQMMRRIRTRYSLYYQMPGVAPGKQRTVRVELSPDAAGRNPKAVVRARKGYVVPAKTSGVE